MSHSLNITASIVLYKNESYILREAIKSFLNTTLNVRLYLIDNSPTDELRNIYSDNRIEYIFNNKNLGFGKAHNIIIKRILNFSKYHLVLNPDISFKMGVLENIFKYMEENPNVGQLLPQVKYPSGEIQHLCKMLPTPMDLFGRRFLGNNTYAQKRNYNYELRFTGYNYIMNVPYLSGCFMFLRNSTLKEVGLFDERIFMYIEDADLTRRIHRSYKTLFYPNVEITHHYAKGSYKSLKLFLYNLHGAIIYFNKYGWFFDRERKIINNELLAKWGKY